MQTENYSSQSGLGQDQCIADCLACFSECWGSVSHCLRQGGAHVEERHIKLMIECAQICEASFRLMKFQSPFSYEHCQLCAKVCEACAESCANVDLEDEMMQKCADLCRRCAQSCRNMSH